MPFEKKTTRITIFLQTFYPVHSLPKFSFSFQKNIVANDLFQILKKGSDSEQMVKLNEDFW